MTCPARPHPAREPSPPVRPGPSPGAPGTGPHIRPPRPEKRGGHPIEPPNNIMELPDEPLQHDDLLLLIGLPVTYLVGHVLPVQSAQSVTGPEATGTAGSRRPTALVKSSPRLDSLRGPLSR